MLTSNLTPTPLLCFLVLLNAVSLFLPFSSHHLNQPSSHSFIPSVCLNSLHSPYHHLSFLVCLFITCHLYRWIQCSVYRPDLLGKSPSEVSIHAHSFPCLYPWRRGGRVNVPLTILRHVLYPQRLQNEIKPGLPTAVTFSLT